MDKTRGISIGERIVDCIKFTNNMVILAKSETKLSEILKALRRTSAKSGIKINKKHDNEKNC